MDEALGLEVGSNPMIERLKIEIEGLKKVIEDQEGELAKQRDSAEALEEQVETLHSITNNVIADLECALAEKCDSAEALKEQVEALHSITGSC
jgi:predicted RNase H-like nuclease (RuvC/YqgF family)